ncbi:hypothetical protein ACFQ0B_60365 [Nonomuraea thailandensis]
MGKQLADAVPAFRAAIRRCDAAISRHLGEPLWDDERGLTPAAPPTCSPRCSPTRWRWPRRGGRGASSRPR